MATHDYVIANGTGSAVRSDLNNALAAIVSNNSSSSEPATKYAYQWWADTTTGQLKLRNSANNGWVTIFELDGTMLMEDGTVSAPGLAFASDLNTGFFRSAADKINFATGGAERLEIGSSEVVFNDPSNDVDFRVESNGQTHMLFVDGGNDRVGIGTSSPTETLTLNTASGASIGFEHNGTEIATISNNDAALYVHAGSGKLLSLGAGGSEKARIDSSGNLGLGTSSPAALLHLKSDTPYIRFEDDNDNQDWQIEARSFFGIYDVTDSAFRLVIDGSGNTLVGKTASSGLTAGCELRASGMGVFTRASANPMQVRRLTDDGDLIEFYQDSGLIGSIGVQGSDLTVGMAGPEKLRIDSSGKIGINESTPDSKVDILFSTGDDTATQGLVHLRTNGSGSYVGRGLFVKIGRDGDYDNSAARYDIVGSAGNSGTHVFEVNNTERMRIDASGRMLLGTSTSRSNAVVASKLQIEGTGAESGLSIIRNGSGNAAYLQIGSTGGSSVGSTTASPGNTDFSQIVFSGSDGSVMKPGAYITAQVDQSGAWSSGDCPTALKFSTTADGASSPTERMRISQNGGINTFSASDHYFAVRNNGTSSSLNAFIVFQGATATTNGTPVMVVRQDGDLENANNNYGSLSDVKLKENIVDAGSQWNDLKTLQVRKYNFKAETGYSTHTQIGLIAQEIELVSPGLVSESPDKDGEGNDLGTTTKSVSYSVLYMKAIKALQEAMERIETLETKVTALEAG